MSSGTHSRMREICKVELRVPKRYLAIRRLVHVTEIAPYSHNLLEALFIDIVELRIIRWKQRVPN